VSGSIRSSSLNGCERCSDQLLGYGSTLMEQKTDIPLRQPGHNFRVARQNEAAGAADAAAWVMPAVLESPLR
jgi:hypothetical protein